MPIAALIPEAAWGTAICVTLITTVTAAKFIYY